MWLFSHIKNVRANIKFKSNAPKHRKIYINYHSLIQSEDYGYAQKK